MTSTSDSMTVVGTRTRGRIRLKSLRNTALATPKVILGFILSRLRPNSLDARVSLTWTASTAKLGAQEEDFSWHPIKRGA
ncbi:hypothetical protein V2J09_015904 [Rumex salicifolius]